MKEKNLTQSKALNELKKLEMVIGRYLPKKEIERLVGKKITKEFINKKILKKVKEYYVINKRTL
jgi:hypothetical protein